MAQFTPMICSELIENIYIAAQDSTRWDAVSEGLMNAIGGVQTIMNHFDAQTHDVVGRAGSVRDDVLEVCQTEHHVNPWTEAVVRAGTGHVVNIEAHMRFDEMRKTGFYADVLRPGGVAHGLGFMIRSDDISWLGVAFGRSRNWGPFGTIQTEIVRAYVPHIRRAVALAARFDGMAHVQRSELEALDLLGTAAVLVDDAGCVLLANRAAHALDARGALFLAAAPRCADRAAAPAFQATVLAAVRGLSPPPVRFRDVEGLPLVLTAAPVGRRAAARLSHEVGPRPAAAVLFVFTTAAGSNASGAVLQALFNLTPAEARVAAEIALGDGERDAAQRLGISMNSVKTHRQRIFQKIGISRRSELVRLLARLPLDL